jgi:hypothetical protein
VKLYEPLIERDLDAIPAAVRTFLEELPARELFVAVARFAVLAYAPSLHSKRAVMACRAAWDLRDAMGERWPDLLIECARYAAESRRPWSEPPILDEIEAPDQNELRARARGDARLMLDTALALLPVLGEKGKGALLRMAVQELEAEPHAPPDPAEPVEVLVQRAIEAKGSVESVRDVFVATSSPSGRSWKEGRIEEPPIYHLARDLAQTVIAHATPVPDHLRAPFLAAVHHNLAHGESLAGWS